MKTLRELFEQLKLSAAQEECSNVNPNLYELLPHHIFLDFPSKCTAGETIKYFFRESFKKQSEWFQLRTGKFQSMHAKN